MIVEAIITAGLSLLQTIIELLPADSLDYPDGTGLGATLGEMAGPMNALAPVVELVDIIGVSVTTVVPAVLAYRLTLFVWGKIPVVGTGS